MLNLKKSTSCGTFTVTIETREYPAGTMLLNSDCARSAKELSEILAEAATTALRLAITLLQPGGPQG